MEMKRNIVIRKGDIAIECDVSVVATIVESLQTKTTIQQYREALIQAEREPTSKNKKLLSKLRKTHKEEILMKKKDGDIFKKAKTKKHKKLLQANRFKPYTKEDNQMIRDAVLRNKGNRFNHAVIQHFALVFGRSRKSVSNKLWHTKKELIKEGKLKK